MSEILQKHSRLPRKMSSPPAEPRKLTVAKRPLSHLTPERRSEIASQVLDRYMAGEQVADMAVEYETSDVTIYALLLREYESDWKDIQEARALARLERANNACRTAPDALCLARAREELRSAQWELERLCRRLYGEEKNTQTIVAPILNISVNATPGSLSLAPARPGQVLDIDHIPTASQQSEKSLTDQ